MEGLLPVKYVKSCAASRRIGKVAAADPPGIVTLEQKHLTSLLLAVADAWPSSCSFIQQYRTGPSEEASVAKACLKGDCHLGHWTCIATYLSGLL